MKMVLRRLLEKEARKTTPRVVKQDDIGFSASNPPLQIEKGVCAVVPRNYNRSILHKEKERKACVRESGGCSLSSCKSGLNTR